VKTAEHAIAADEQVRVAHLLAAEWHVGQTGLDRLVILSVGMLPERGTSEGLRAH
jgi:hypothetical protein